MRGVSAAARGSWPRPDNSPTCKSRSAASTNPPLLAARVNSLAAAISCPAMVADAELRPILDQLRQALPPAHAAMEEVRRRLEICWPRKPSLNALDAEAHDLCKAAMQLVVAGGRSTWGASPMLITAGKDTLSAFGVQSSDPFDVASWEWNPQSVDSEAPSHLAMSAATLLHEALSNAEECNREIGRLLDDIGRLAPAESWLPEWSVDHATAYIAGVRWRSSRPPQPPLLPFFSVLRFDP